MRKIKILLVILSLTLTTSLSHGQTKGKPSSSKKIPATTTKNSGPPKAQVKSGNFMKEICHGSGSVGEGITKLIQMRKSCAEVIWECIEKKINTVPNTKLYLAKEKIKIGLFEAAFFDQMAPRLMLDTPGITFKLVEKKNQPATVECQTTVEGILEFIKSSAKNPNNSQKPNQDAQNNQNKQEEAQAR